MQLVGEGRRDAGSRASSGSRPPRCRSTWSTSTRSWRSQPHRGSSRCLRPTRAGARSSRARVLRPGRDSAAASARGGDTGCAGRRIAPRARPVMRRQLRAHAVDCALARTVAAGDVVRPPPGRRAVGPGEQRPARPDAERTCADRVEAAAPSAAAAPEARPLPSPPLAFRPGEQRQPGPSRSSVETQPRGDGTHTCAMRPPRSACSSSSACRIAPVADRPSGRRLCSATGRRSAS